VPGPSTCTWRGCWNPSGAIADQFWSDYEAYLIEIADLAAKHNVDRMNVGTEMREINGDSAHNDNWNDVINAVDAVYDGPLGYAANWDHWAFGSPGNVTYIFDHPAIDYVGIDSYFTNLVSESHVNASGIYPNAAFISQVEQGWIDLLENIILPYAAARKDGVGMPVVFTEFGHLPFNGTAADPQNQDDVYQPSVLDKDEQLMAFQAFFNAIDGRQDIIPALHIWQWEMAGSGDSLWNINPEVSPDQPHNDRIADWLVNFVATATVVPETAGDYNEDGAVNGADYTVWRDTLGESVPNFSGADGSGNGSVGPEDYILWKSQVVAASSARAERPRSVPEPSTVLLGTLLGTAFLTGRAQALRHSRRSK
jgi:hypothetical protein